jgi:hypothetical protein
MPELKRRPPGELLDRASTSKRAGDGAVPGGEDVGAAWGPLGLRVPLRHPPGDGVAALPAAGDQSVGCSGSQGNGIGEDAGEALGQLAAGASVALQSRAVLAVASAPVAGALGGADAVAGLRTDRRGRAELGASLERDAADCAGTDPDD